jgi:hypothetical protein
MTADNVLKSNLCTNIDGTPLLKFVLLLRVVTLAHMIITNIRIVMIFGIACWDEMYPPGYSV